MEIKLYQIILINIQKIFKKKKEEKKIGKNIVKELTEEYINKTKLLDEELKLINQN